MKIRFTASKVAAFRCPPEKKQAFLWDSDTNGLGLKASPGGSKKYILESRLKSGETIRITIGDPRSWSIAAAQEEARRLQTSIDQGNDPRKLLTAQLPPRNITSIDHLNCWPYGMTSTKLGFWNRPVSRHPNVQ